jgi:hypothetical protein
LGKMAQNQHRQITLEPLDFVLAVKVYLGPGQKWTYRHLADELCLSVSNAHKSAKRACASKLLSVSPESELTANSAGLREFTLHGVAYAFPATTGAPTRGVPTAYAGPILKDILAPSNEPPPVWPFREGKVQGYALLPLVPSVPAACARDGKLYELLSLVDALRIGSARIRAIATEHISRILL